MNRHKQLDKTSATEAAGSILEGALAAIAAYSDNPTLGLIIGVSQVAKNKNNFYRVKMLGDDLKRMLRQGEISEEEINSQQAVDSFNDLLNIIEKDNIDSHKFEALKKLFKLSLTGIPNDKNRYIREMMNLCNQLESTQIIILGNLYLMINKEEHYISQTGISAHNQVLDQISTQSTIDQDLVLYHWDKMVDSKFLNQRFYEIQSSTFENRKFKLPILTNKLCELLSTN